MSSFICYHKNIKHLLGDLFAYFAEQDCQIEELREREGEKISFATDMIPDIFLLPAGEERLIAALRRTPEFDGTPILAITERYDDGEELEALAAGASDYRAFDNVLGLVKKIDQHIEMSREKKQNAYSIAQLSVAVEHERSESEVLQEILLSTVAEMVEFRDTVTGGHVKRTALYLEAMIRTMQKYGIYENESSSWDISLVTSSSMLHDVGKIKTSDSVLLKPGKLTKEEFKAMQLHPTVGAKLLSAIQGNMNNKEYLNYAITFAKYHHEKWNGTGYPDRLKKNDIPLLGRLMAIVDVYDALLSKRPYKESMTVEEAERIIVDGAGKDFDPVLVEVFKKTTPYFANIRAELEDSGVLKFLLPEDEYDEFAEMPEAVEAATDRDACPSSNEESKATGAKPLSLVAEAG
ncbi:MAG: HD domain-containing protein [Clostridiales Family XIII bacterium]|jgi:putative two-component system response regulator|nr:HD domain-containing protein [Clostridiales Family XIII bacterium]